MTRLVDTEVMLVHEAVARSRRHGWGADFERRASSAGPAGSFACSVAARADRDQVFQDSHVFLGGGAFGTTASV